MCVCGGGGWGGRMKEGGGGNWRSRELHLTERKTVTAILLNDSPNRLKQRSNKFIRQVMPPDEHFGCSYY